MLRRATSQLRPARSCDVLLPTCYDARSKEVLLQYFYYNSRESTWVCHATGTPVHNLEQELEGENGLELRGLLHQTIGYVAGQSDMPMLESLLTSQLASMHSARGPAQLDERAASHWIFPMLGRLEASGPRPGFFNKDWPLFIRYLAGHAALSGDEGPLLDKLWRLKPPPGQAAWE